MAPHKDDRDALAGKLGGFDRPENTLCASMSALLRVYSLKRITDLGQSSRGATTPGPFRTHGLVISNGLTCEHLTPAAPRPHLRAAIKSSVTKSRRVRWDRYNLTDPFNPE